MKYKIQIESAHEGTIDLHGAGLTLEEFKEMTWEEQYDIIQSYADVVWVDNIDWIVSEEKPKEDIQ